MAKPKIIVIVGPNASGKSALAVRLAKKFNGEIISADSRQVYRGLNLGSGKISKKEMAGVPHHLLDVASPRRTFTVAQFRRLAEKATRRILQRNKLPIICGGTGFYVQTITDNLTLPPVPPNLKLRRRLEKLTLEKLLKKLRALDLVRAENIDSRNRRRLIRAIEIATALGRVPPLEQRESPYDVLKLGLKVENEKLKTKIRKRLNARLRQGLIAEVEKLHRGGLSWKRLEQFGLEYRYVAKYLRGQITKQELITQLEHAIWHYAKRQMTWFKRDTRIKWVKNYTEAELLVRRFMDQSYCTKIQRSHQSGTIKISRDGVF